MVDIYKELQRVPGVVDVLDVKILQKTGSPYSEIAYDLEGALSNDGRFINGVKDVIFELKYPTTDIQGSVT